MKISSDRLEGLLPQEHIHKTAGDGKAFEDLLAQQLGQGQASEAAVSSTGAKTIDPLLFVNSTDETQASAEEAMLAGMFDQADGLLHDWEDYAKSLGSGQDKAAWNLLTGLDSRIKDLRGDVGQLGARGNGLDAVLNELEVLTATEKFKFNRGDYQ